MSYRMTPRGHKSAPKVNLPGILNRIDPFTSDGTKKDPDHSPTFRSVLEFILGKAPEMRHELHTESVVITRSDTLYVNGTPCGSGADLQGLLRAWWDNRGLLNEGPYAPRAFQCMLDDTIGYQDGARRIIIRDFLK